MTNRVIREAGGQGRNRTTDTRIFSPLIDRAASRSNFSWSLLVGDFVVTRDGLSSPSDLQATENMARPERFELPTPWFVGPMTGIETFTNQQLAALATRLLSMVQSQLRYRQPDLVSTSSH